MNRERARALAERLEAASDTFSRGDTVVGSEVGVLSMKELCADAAALLRSLTEQWRTIDSAPKCTASERFPVMVTRFPFTGHHAPVAVSRLTTRGWTHGKAKTPLWFEPTHWRDLPDVGAHNCAAPSVGQEGETHV